MPDNKAFWSWFSTTYGEDLKDKFYNQWLQKFGFFSVDFPPEVQSQFNYWKQYIEPQGFPQISPLDYTGRAETHLQRAVERGDMTYEEYLDARASVESVLDSLGIADIKDGVLLDKEGNALDIKTVPPDAPFLSEATNLKPDWAYKVQQKQIKDYQDALAKQQKEQEKLQEAEKQAKTEEETKVNVKTAQTLTRQNEEQFNLAREQALSESSLKANAANITRRAGGQADVTGGTLTSEIQKAREAGIDTSQAEATLGVYANNENRQNRAYQELHKQLGSITLGQQEQQGRSLQTQYPSFWNKYQDTLAGLKPTGNERPEAFPEWLKGNVEFKEFKKQQEQQAEIDKQFRLLSRKARIAQI